MEERNPWLAFTNADVHLYATQEGGLAARVTWTSDAGVQEVRYVEDASSWILCGLPIDLVDAALRRMGIDPAEIANRAIELLEEKLGMLPLGAPERLTLADRRRRLQEHVAYHWAAEFAVEMEVRRASREQIIARADELLAQPPAPLRTCNRHDDCNAADIKARGNGFRNAEHCHDDECSDCFGS